MDTCSRHVRLIRVFVRPRKCGYLSWDFNLVPLFLEGTKIGRRENKQVSVLYPRCAESRLRTSPSSSSTSHMPAINLLDCTSHVLHRIYLPMEACVCSPRTQPHLAATGEEMAEPIWLGCLVPYGLSVLLQLYCERCLFCQGK